MVHDVLMPKFYLIHKWVNWCRSFPDQEALVEFLKENGFTRARLDEYWLIHGEGVWCQIAAELPFGETMVTQDQSPF